MVPLSPWVSAPPRACFRPCRVFKPPLFKRTVSSAARAERPAPVRQRILGGFAEPEDGCGKVDSGLVAGGEIVEAGGDVLSTFASMVSANTNARGTGPSRPVGGQTRRHSRYPWPINWSIVSGREWTRSTVCLSVSRGGNRLHFPYRRSLVTRSCASSVWRSISSSNIAIPAVGVRITRPARCAYPSASRYGISAAKPSRWPVPARCSSAAVEVTAATWSSQPAPSSWPVSGSYFSSRSAEMRMPFGSSGFFASRWPRAVSTRTCRRPSRTESILISR